MTLLPTLATTMLPIIITLHEVSGQWVQYKLAVTIHRCLRNQAPPAAINWRAMKTGHPSTRAVNSGSGNRALGCCSFASAGPTVWNSLGNPAVGPDQFWRNLKPTCLRVVSVLKVDSVMQKYGWCRNHRSNYGFSKISSVTNGFL